MRELMTKGIEVFRDLNLVGKLAARPRLREALIRFASGQWSFDRARTDEVSRNVFTQKEILLFRFDANGDGKPAGLTLWGNQQGYSVPNIVPVETRSLSVSEYNSVLEDFILNVAGPRH
jgi:hypothetical protein